MLEGVLSKMRIDFTEGEPASYRLPIGSEQIHLNPLLGKKLNLEFTKQIFCCHCGRKTNKSFQGGYCFPCMRQLPETDMCMVKPEACHYQAGTCRDSSWGEKHCMITHNVYLANSSGIKVGITRGEPIKRWLDQGASQGVVFLETPNRLESGIVESAIKKAISDKTNWRAMLKGPPDYVNLEEVFRGIYGQIPDHYKDHAELQKPIQLEYPILEYPKKISSYNFDKDPVIEDTLMGMKGQYLIFSKAVINIRKFTGYHVRLATD